MVSIVIPVYNVEDYLEECLDSVRNQTWKNYEVLLVDDGSPDGSPAICDRYAAMDHRFRVIHKKNGGLSSARNAALDVARGDCVFCLDSDDYLAPGALEILCRARREQGAQIVICANYMVRGDRITIEDPVVDSTEIYGRFDALSALIEDRLIRNYACGKLVDRNLYDQVRYPEGRIYEDLATSYLLFDRAERIVRIPDLLLYYRMREGSLSSHTSMKQWHNACHAISTAMVERREFFRKKHEEELAARAMAKMLPYLYADIHTGYRTGAKEDAAYARRYLKENREQILTDSSISNKDKKLLRQYLAGPGPFFAVQGVKPAVRTARALERRMREKIAMGRLSFALSGEQTHRIVYFELPCADNLGDHAVRYASAKYLRSYAEKQEKARFFAVGAQDTEPAVRSLKHVIGPDDVIVLQGGNLGNSSGRAEEVRRKILKTFSHSRILLLPQTVSYADDENGRKSLAEDRKVFDRCRRLVVFAGNPKSEEFLRANFRAKVIPMKDMVLSLGNVEDVVKRRKGILLALRSDLESALTGEMKEEILQVSGRFTRDVFVTDTCVHREMRDDAEAEELLRRKWSLFSGKELIITDRLQGMMFAVITGTPCIVVGSENSVLAKTYPTVSGCGYLDYVTDTGKLEDAIGRMMHAAGKKKYVPDYSRDFRKLDRMLAGAAGV
jgi:glycosyltransferase involved in cell wall biosynthesis/exopolysaccharide biosynthesis predicted pyruvyltransferase EpsI